MADTTPAGDNRVMFRLEPDDADWLESRRVRMFQASRHVQARVELSLWRAVLRAELRRIRMTVGQAACLADITGGSVLDATVGAHMGLLYAEAFDAFRLARDAGGEVSSYGRRHGVDEQELLDLLADLGPAADAALRDALSRWWAFPEPLDADADGFRRAGMTIIDSPAGDPADGANEEENTK